MRSVFLMNNLFHAKQKLQGFDYHKIEIFVSFQADEFTGPSKQNIEEFDRLCTLVQLQAQEIEALKAEISILSRKGGHILPPNPAVLPQNS